MPAVTAPSGTGRVASGLAPCLLASLLLCGLPNPLRADDTASCAAHIGQWLDPASGETLDGERLFTRLAKSRILLLGETHTEAAHHRWQYYVLAALYSRQPDMMVGFEMLPRTAQPVLNE